MLNPGTRTKRVKAALRARKIEILSCRSPQPEWTALRVYNSQVVAADISLRHAGFNDIRGTQGPFCTELEIWA